MNYTITCPRVSLRCVTRNKFLLVSYVIIEWAWESSLLIKNNNMWFWPKVICAHKNTTYSRRQPSCIYHCRFWVVSLSMVIAIEWWCMWIFTPRVWSPKGYDLVHVGATPCLSYKEQLYMYPFWHAIWRYCFSKWRIKCFTV